MRLSVDLMYPLLTGNWCCSGARIATKINLCLKQVIYSTIRGSIGLIMLGNENSLFFPLTELLPGLNNTISRWPPHSTSNMTTKGTLYLYYRPQRSCEGYVFTGVCLSTGGEYLTRYPPGTRYIPRDQVHPPGTRYTNPPGTRYTPQDQVHPPTRHRHPPGTRYTPPTPGTPQNQVHPPEIRPLLRTVRILRECILVHIMYDSSTCT